ncbi:tetratricopeptide repeat protein [Lignipirellula cremea]|uniref:Tetratricopeptide repeat protein n=1 Tax=Lignipirellula cremea TaxID=2528010 RepID=A0A518DW12_9BACT|nr:tetratricopeptide repeat protein [Lignipirellula cremea]QDU96025.1 tetratricopeptide repeat protein [Lignipirellula cremea]
MKISTLLLTLAFCLPCLVSPAQQPLAEAPIPAVSPKEAEAAEELFQAGRNLFFQGKYLEAAEKLQKAVAGNPAKTSYKLLLAKAHRYGQQPEKAIAVFEAILRENGSHVEAGIELAELLDPLKESDRVIGVLEPLLKYKHDYPLYHLLAQANYQKENFEKAQHYYEEATRLNDQNADDHYQLGNIYLAQQRFAKAAVAYERAGDLGVSTGVYHFKLASVYFNLHNYLGAVHAAQIIGGQTGQIKNELYLLDPVPGQKDFFYVCPPQSAVYQTAKAQQLGVDVFDIRFLEANIWLSARRYARANPMYAELEEEVSKANAGLFWYYWAQAALGMDDLEQYLVRLDKAIAADPEVYKPTKADALVTVAERHQQQGDTAKHSEYLQQAVAVTPLSARLHLMLGDAHWIASERRQAVEQYKLVLELEPQHADRVRLLNRIREAS